MFRALAILASQMMGVFYFETFQSLQLTNIVLNSPINKYSVLYWEQNPRLGVHGENYVGTIFRNQTSFGKYLWVHGQSVIHSLRLARHKCRVILVQFISMHIYLAQYSKLHISHHRPSVSLKDIVGAIPILYDNLFFINILNKQGTLCRPII